MLITEYMEGGDLYHAIAQDSIGRFAWYRRYDPQTWNAPSRVYTFVSVCNIIVGMLALCFVTNWVAAAASNVRQLWQIPWLGMWTQSHAQ